MISSGILLMALGILFLLNNASVISFERSWPILLIVVGGGILRYRWRDIGGWIVLLVGGCFLFSEALVSRVPPWTQYVWPVVLVVAGSYLLFRPARRNS